MVACPRSRRSASRWTTLRLRPGLDEPPGSRAHAACGACWNGSASWPRSPGCASGTRSSSGSPRWRVPADVADHAGVDADHAVERARPAAARVAAHPGLRRRRWRSSSRLARAAARPADRSLRVRCGRAAPARPPSSPGARVEMDTDSRGTGWRVRDAHLLEEAIERLAAARRRPAASGRRAWRPAA